MFGTVPASATGPGEHEDPILKTDATNTQIVIRNYNSLDVQIFAVTEGGKRYELGTVKRGAERSFDGPERLVESGVEFRLKIYSLARAVPPSVIDNHVAGVKTQPLSMTVGEELRIMVRSPLVSSFVERG